MRLRNKNWTKEYIEKNNSLMIKTENKVMVENLFEKTQKTYLEIGCGKGQFIIKNAIKYENQNYIAMEKETTVIGIAIKKAIETFKGHPKNLKFLNCYAEKLLDIFLENTFDGIYLNFSDPWPKKKHYKKRLTYICFLNIYEKLLKKDGLIEIKTDNDNLYEFSLEQIKDSNFELIFSTNDLYKYEKNLVNNIATEYEEKFHSQNKTINKLVIKKIR
ncbi:tRNA (guanosine(46)-N7)-methyltransferase TrmB [Spiroplasma tabanidicola]|uniref:tRNA (guanine-N(7)-)-methyltransferase n=1 Tax=Spiroplasma tabanidicola TaxID=324079 RepID=A0A6I6C9G4_9MOLU|nr:tRNA (guanosine(46)-N7)-methyltransferase TrmB [Spiroplasma tabanidicola]QGS51541.1 tRNA (guanine-N(7)-)-methyltransferase [Spiroplasma tabanidicola]